MTPEPDRPLRADAERNRTLILETADRLLGERGSAVTLNEVAHAAGIGVATVYRRFPDLQTLIDALFAQRFTAFHELATAAAGESDAGQALRRYLLDGAEWRAGDPALEHVLAHASVEAGPIGQMRDDLGQLVDGLVERALQAKAVRGDFASADVYNFLFIVGAVADRTRGIAPDAWRRYAQILLVGFGLQDAGTADPVAMTDAELRRAWPKKTS